MLQPISFNLLIFFALPSIAMAAPLGIQHPRGPSIGDIMEVFVDPQAPPLSEYQGCEKKYFDFSVKKTTSVKTPEEVARELVRTHPEEMHWCFYVRLLEIANPLNQDENPVGIQNRLVEAFRFLTPVAKAFRSETGEVGYLVSASIQYRELNRRYFGKNLELVPEVTSALVESWRQKRLKLEEEAKQ